MPESGGQVNDQAAGSNDLELFGFGCSADRWLNQFREAEAGEPLGTLGPYQILSEAARGGQGVVYRARGPAGRGDIAVKRLYSGSVQTQMRFDREIAAVRQLDHPNIVSAFAADLISGQPVLAMEWINGLPITSWAKTSRPTVDEILVLFLKVCDAVHHAHQRGVIHRDLKPSNILVDDSGTPHVLDFGLARVLDATEQDTKSPTRTAQFVGTPAYASPEQLECRPEQVDIRTDVYSLGVILYELLTSSRPFDAHGSTTAVLQRRRMSTAPRPSGIRPGLSRELDGILLKALAPDQDKRYQSVEALAEDLRRFRAGEPVLAQAPSMWYLLRMLARRHLAATVTAVVAVVAVAAAALTTGIMAHQANEARNQERAARVVAEQVSAFLSDTLSSARPSRGGPDFTVLEALEEAGRRADEQLVEHPAVAAEVYYAIGSTYRALWRSREAEPYLRRALELNLELFQGDHEKIARSLTGLGAALTNLHDADAVELQRRGLEMRRRLYGSQHLLVAESLTRLAYALHQCPPDPRWSEAEALFNQALEMYHAVAGDTHRDLASCLHNQGWMRVRQRRLPEAAALYEQALDIFRRLGDREDPFYAECLFGYTAQLRKLGRDEDNLAVLQEAIPLVRRIYGDAAALQLLWPYADTLRDLGHLDRAAATYRASFESLCLVLLRDHPEHEPALDHLKRTLFGQRAEDAPLPVHTILQTAADLPARGRVRLVVGVEQYARLLHVGGQSGAAVELLHDTLRMLAELDDERHDAMAGCLEALGDISADRERRESARTWYQQSLEAWPVQAGSRGRRAVVASKLGACLAEPGRVSEAADMIREAQQVLESHYGTAHRFTRAGAARLAHLASAG